MESIQESFEQQLKRQLKTLDQQAETLGSDRIRGMIAAVLDDMPEPAGKDNARLAIAEISDLLMELRGRPSGIRENVVPSMNFDEASAS